MADDHVPRPAAVFVGDHLALDFLNTLSASSGAPEEWLRDGADLLSWLQLAGVINGTVADRFRAPQDGDSLDSVAEEARRLREWLRDFVRRHAGRQLDAGTIAELGPLNELLARDDSHLQVTAGGADASRRADKSPRPLARPLDHPLRERRVRRWTSPAQLLQPLAEAILDLVCYADFRLIRVCEGAACTLMFLDRTKAHARRWCSMAVCGNRAKVAAHRARNASARKLRQGATPPAREP